MNYCKIIENDIANGEGVRVSLFVSGCTNHCEKCFQPQTWDFNYGEPFTKKVEDKIIKLLSKSYISGLTLLGGDPFEPNNQRCLIEFLKRIRAEASTKNIWAYSGFTIEHLLNQNQYCHCEVTEEMLSMIDVLVDGRYVDALYDISLRFRGSSNQRIIDVHKTLDSGSIVTLD